MKQVAMDGVAPFLPQEIITNILKCLPVKSLIRFQCVCKHWKNLIKSPAFIAAHLRHSTQHRPSLIFNDYPMPNRLQLYMLDCEMQIVEVQNLPVFDGEVWVAGSSNGLLCLRFYRHAFGLSPPRSLLLWNPAFREVRQVFTTCPDFDGDCYIGFGFSPIVNDYKIVALYFPAHDEEVHLVEVYSLVTGSWKNIEIVNLKGIILTSHDGFTMDGAIFWTGFREGMAESGERVIVSFDIAMEEFALIPLPAVDQPISHAIHAVDQPITHAIHVTEFEHRLAILCSTRIGNPRSCLIELWVLEEGTTGSRERWSWAKKFASSPSQGLLCPRTIWRNEIACTWRPLPQEFVESTVMSNLTCTELKVLFDHGNFIFNYVESLVPVSNIHIEES